MLTASPADGLAVDGKPFTGAVRLTEDSGPVPGARVALGERRFVVLVREGIWGVRDFDPASGARRAFRGIDAPAYDPRWSVPGRFTPYEESRTVRVRNADGRERGLGLAGELAFAFDGQELTLQVAQQGDGTLWAVFADVTLGLVVEAGERTLNWRPFPYVPGMPPVRLLCARLSGVILTDGACQEHAISARSAGPHPPARPSASQEEEQ